MIYVNQIKRRGLMSLENLIVSSNKEIAGSRTKNRLTVQISYAIQLIMEFYSTDFVVMMDYIEDVAIISNPDNPSAIHMYQIKTKSADRQYKLTAVIKDEWFQKLYANALKYNGYVGSASLVCNTDIVSSNNTEIFPNSKTSLNDVTIQKNINKIKEAIAHDQNIDLELVDLSNFYFIRSYISTKGHKEEVEHQFEDFLLNLDNNLQVATVKSIYKLLYSELDEKFNHEISENCTDINEIYDQKGFSGESIKSIIDCGLSIQIPTLEKLFSEFEIKSVAEKRNYTLNYSKIKRDMFSNMGVFIELKKQICCIIQEVNNSGIDDLPGLLDGVYTNLVNGKNVLSAYSDEYYLKILIMVLIYKYCYGGE